MKCSHVFLFIIVLFSVLDGEARGGGGRGGRGRGRGRSGARGRVRAKTVTSQVRGSSSFSGGVRSGTSGFKVGTKTATTADYGSAAFRSHVFQGGFQRGKGPNPLVIRAATVPLFYDNRHYYWSYNTARVNWKVSRSSIICEYVFGNDDGELQNMTFSNGTRAHAIYFGCSGMVDCCGMYCCHDFHQYFELLFLLGFVFIFLFIAYYAKKREPAPEPKTRPPNKKSQEKENETKLFNGL